MSMARAQFGQFQPTKLVDEARSQRPITESVQVTGTLCGRITIYIQSKAHV